MCMSDVSDMVGLCLMVGWTDACMMDAERELCDIVAMLQSRRKHEAQQRVEGGESLVGQFLFPALVSFILSSIYPSLTPLLLA